MMLFPPFTFGNSSRLTASGMSLSVVFALAFAVALLLGSSSSLPQAVKVMAAIIARIMILIFFMLSGCFLICCSIY